MKNFLRITIGFCLFFLSILCCHASFAKGVGLALIAPMSMPRKVVGGVSQIVASPVPSSDTPVNLTVPGTQLGFTSQKDHDDANHMELPDEIVVSITSVNVPVGPPASNPKTDVYIFNQTLDGMQNITDNGGGAGTIAYDFEDGANGAIISRMLANQRAAVGGVIFGYSVRTTTVAGVDKPDALAQLKPTWVTPDGKGNIIAKAKSTAGNQTRKDNDKTISVVDQVKNVPDVVQFKASLLVDTIATFVFNAQPNYSH